MNRKELKDILSDDYPKDEEDYLDDIEEEEENW